MIYIAMAADEDINGIQDFMFIGAFDSLEKAEEAKEKHKESKNGWLQEDLYIYDLELNEAKNKKHFDDALSRPKRLND